MIKNFDIIQEKIKIEGNEKFLIRFTLNLNQFIHYKQNKIFKLEPDVQFLKFFALSSHQTLNYHQYISGVHSNPMILKLKPMELKIIESKDSKQKEALLNFRDVVKNTTVVN